MVKHHSRSFDFADVITLLIRRSGFRHFFGFRARAGCAT